MNSTFFLTVILELGTTPAAVFAQNGTPDSDPNAFVDRALECHANYANEYSLASASASEIADAANSECRQHFTDYERTIFTLAIKQGLSLKDAEDSQKELTANLKESCRNFTINLVIKLRGTNAR